MKKALKFYNVATKKKFTTNNYTIKKIKGHRFAVAKNAGTRCFRIVGKSQ